MINLNTHLETLSSRFGYEIYLEEKLDSKNLDPKIRFRIETTMDTFHLQISRSWKTTKIEFVPGAFASRTVSFLCVKVLEHKSELVNILPYEIYNPNIYEPEKIDETKIYCKHLISTAWSHEDIR